MVAQCACPFAGASPYVAFRDTASTRLVGSSHSTLGLTQFVLMLLKAPEGQTCRDVRRPRADRSAARWPVTSSSRYFALQEWSEVSLEGFRIASAGREAVDQCLDRLVERARARGVVSLEETYGYLFMALDRSLADPAFAPIRDAVREHIVANVPLAAGARVLDCTLDERCLGNVRSAAVAAGTTWPTMRKMLARTGVVCSPRGGQDGGSLTRTVVKIAEIEDLIARHAGSVGSTEFGEATGVTRKHLREMVSRGLILTLDGGLREYRGKIRFLKTDIDAFLERLFAGAVDIEVPAPGRSRSAPPGRAPRRRLAPSSTLS